MKRLLVIGLLVLLAAPLASAGLYTFNPAFDAGNRFTGRRMQDIEIGRRSFGATRDCQECGEQDKKTTPRFGAHVSLLLPLAF